MSTHLVDKPPRSIATKIAKAIGVIAAIVIISKAFSFLGAIHGKTLPESYFSNGYPTIIGLLNSEVFMGLIFLVTLSIFAYVAYLLWQLHEVAVHKAEGAGSPHIQLVFALSLCGLFIDKTWWVLAIIIAFTSWGHIAHSLSRIVRGEVSAPQTTDTKKEGEH
ncbi:hypothetical protein ACFSJY_14975 [Thalassotalea euphylliae]|uniref:hypothetical protein n=1 Tax=Thalassotalea euphylliae TaxID=1655234 RepID=UPI00363CAC6C